MAVRFLLDEHVEHEVMHRLEKLGYPVAHVEFTPSSEKERMTPRLLHSPDNTTGLSSPTTPTS